MKAKDVRCTIVSWCRDSTKPDVPQCKDNSSCIAGPACDNARPKHWSPRELLSETTKSRNYYTRRALWADNKCSGNSIGLRIPVHPAPFGAAQTSSPYGEAMDNLKNECCCPALLSCKTRIQHDARVVQRHGTSPWTPGICARPHPISMEPQTTQVVNHLDLSTSNRAANFVVRSSSVLRPSLVPDISLAPQDPSTR